MSTEVSTIKISVDPISLLVSMNYGSSDIKIGNDLRILFSNSSQEISIFTDRCILPWHDFKRMLVPFSRLAKKENLKVVFDDFALKLIKEHVSDRKHVKHATDLVNIPESEINAFLSKIHFDRKLKPEQERDASKLLKLKHGANFSVPGAGKTTTILAVHAILRHFNLVSKLFVVSPINAFISWEDEIADIFKNSSLKVLRLSSALIDNYQQIIAANADVILVNYEKMRKDISLLTPFFLENRVHLILDESHRIKSGNNNLSYSQIIKISDLASRRDILSGTPMPQSYLDLQPQLDFLWPAEEILPDIARVTEESRIQEINSAIKGLYVRTTKNELDLAEPDVFYTKIPMGPIQTDLYRLFKSETARLISGMDASNRNSFRRMGKSVIRLLQASTNPMLLGSNDNYEEEIVSIPAESQAWELLEEFVKYEKPAKIEYLIKRVDKLLLANPNTKIVIWSYFVRNIKLLERIFKNYNPVSIYGGIATGSDEDENNREGRIRKFHQDATCRLMIANPQACGEGISLHKVCHYAIYLDRNFNAAHFLQSIDRIHRLGLDRETHTSIEILIAEGSIDEVLVYRLNEKILAMGEILEDPYLKTLAYDPADISINEEDGIDARDFEEIRNHVLNNEQK